MLKLMNEVDTVVSVEQVRQYLKQFALEHMTFTVQDKDVIIRRLARLVDKVVYETNYKAYIEHAQSYHVVIKDPIESLQQLDAISSTLNHLNMSDFGISRILNNAEQAVYEEGSTRCCMTYDVAKQIQMAISCAYEHDVILLEYAEIEHHLSQVHTICYDVMCVVWARERIRTILKRDLRSGDIQSCLDFLAVVDEKDGEVNE